MIHRPSVESSILGVGAVRGLRNRPASEIFSRQCSFTHHGRTEIGKSCPLIQSNRMATLSLCKETLSPDGGPHAVTERRETAWYRGPRDRTTPPQPLRLRTPSRMRRTLDYMRFRISCPNTGSIETNSRAFSVSRLERYVRSERSGPKQSNSSPPSISVSDGGCHINELWRTRAKAGMLSKS